LELVSRRIHDKGLSLIGFNDGTDTFAYIPPVGPGQVFDGAVTDWKIIMVGGMNGDNASFSIEYEVVVQ
jgi:hypothetical protein